MIAPDLPGRGIDWIFCETSKPLATDSETPLIVVGQEDLFASPAVVQAWRGATGQVEAGCTPQS
jgi:hypothetical protein